MTNQRSPRCERVTMKGQPCKGWAVVEADGVWLCGIHANLVGDPRELGKRSGEKRRRKKGSFKAAVRGLLENDPERYAAKLLESGPTGTTIALDILGEEEQRETAAAAAAGLSPRRTWPPCSVCSSTQISFTFCRCSRSRTSTRTSTRLQCSRRAPRERRRRRRRPSESRFLWSPVARPRDPDSPGGRGGVVASAPRSVAITRQLRGELFDHRDHLGQSPRRARPRCRSASSTGGRHVARWARLISASVAVSSGSWAAIARAVFSAPSVNCG